MSERFADEEKLSEIRRELAIRERIYPEWIRIGRITGTRAQQQIDVLRAIERDYQERIDKCRLV